MLLVAFSVALMVCDHHQPHRLGSVHAILSSVAYPLQRIVGDSVALWHKAQEYCTTQEALCKENNQLRNTEFLQQVRLQKLMALESENEQLRALLQSSARLGENLLVAEILKVDGDQFSHQLLLNKGLQAGIYVGQPVLDAQGIIGEVIEVFEKTSRVLLLTDASHGIPVQNVRNGVRGIAMGTGRSKTLDLQYVPNTVDIQVGDLLITSGLGGRYPAGYPVGIISQINRDTSDAFASVQIEASSQLDRTRMVLLIRRSTEEDT